MRPAATCIPYACRQKMRMGKMQTTDLSHTKQADSPAQYERGIYSINWDTNYIAKLLAHQTTLNIYTAQALEVQCIQPWMNHEVLMIITITAYGARKLSEPPYRVVFDWR